MKADRIDIAYGLVAAVFAFSIALLALVTVLAVLEPGWIRGQKRGQSLIRVLHLSTPALVPSGRALRALELVHPAVDLRYVPSLPCVPPDPADLLLGPPGAAGGKGQLQ